MLTQRRLLRYTDVAETDDDAAPHGVGRRLLQQGEDRGMTNDHNYIGHNHIGHNYIGHTYVGHTYIGEDHGTTDEEIGHNYIGHNYIGHKLHRL